MDKEKVVVRPAEKNERESELVAGYSDEQKGTLYGGGGFMYGPPPLKSARPPDQHYVSRRGVLPVYCLWSALLETQPIRVRGFPS